MSAVSIRAPEAPSADLPSLSVRWDGLVVTIDATTLNTVVRKVLRRVEFIKDVLIEPEDGKLGITIHLHKGISVSVRGHITSLRLKNGFLGFQVADLKALGVSFAPFWNWILSHWVSKLPEGMAFYYPGERIVVVNLTSMLPPELSLVIRESVFENGEIRIYFGPSHYRLHRLLEELGADPFSEE